MEISLDDLAVLQYTGGTTGVSKGAMLTHRNLSANVQQSAAWFALIKPGEEVLLACLPYFHVFGMTVSMLWPVHIGAHIVLAPNPRDIPDLIKCITKYRVSIFPAVPALYVAANNYPGVDKLDLSSIRACFSGSAPLPVDVMERFETLTGGRITEGFGMTETSPVTHVNPLFGLRKPGSVGIPVPGTDMKIVDAETGLIELGIGEKGELCIRGPQVMAGYWNRPDETAKVMTNDGFFKSGDMGFMDENGYTKIVDRKKDMILVSGFNVYPNEIEDVVMKMPGVMECAAVGAHDEHSGETVKLYVVKKDPALTEAAVRDFCKEQLTGYKRPKFVVFAKELPKSNVGKILRRELRDNPPAA